MALQEPEAAALLPGMREEERLESWHLIGPDGSVHSAGRAFVPLFRVLPAGRPLAWLAARLPSTSQRLYAFVSRHRGRLGRLIPRRALERADRRIAGRAGV